MNTIYIKGDFSAADAATAAAIAAHGTLNGRPAFFHRDGLCPGANVPVGMFDHKPGSIHSPGVVSLAQK